MSLSQQIAQAGPDSPNSVIVHKYEIRHSSKEYSEAIGTSYNISGSGILSVYMMDRTVASYKRWQSVETVTKDPEEPTSFDKKLNLLEMRITQLDRAVRHGVTTTDKLVTGFPSGVPELIHTTTLKESYDGTYPEKDEEERLL